MFSNDFDQVLIIVKVWSYPCAEVDLSLFQYTIAMMGYGPEDKNAVLELTYNYGVTEYDKGDGYAQVKLSIRQH